MALISHPIGNYQFVPGISPYSCGVIASRGYEVVFVTLREWCSWQAGFDLIESALDWEKRPRSALCAVSLRCPRPYSFQGFSEFNAEYAEVLRSWGLFVDGINPVARTNVAPEHMAPETPSLYGFAYTRLRSDTPGATFVVAGAGELPEGILSREGIVRLAENSSDAIEEKARFVMGLMSQRLSQLGVAWRDVKRTNIYTVHPIEGIARSILQPQIREAGRHGYHWFPSRPPIEEIEFEMDVRGCASEIIL